MEVYCMKCNSAVETAESNNCLVEGYEVATFCPECGNTGGAYIHCGHTPPLVEQW